MGGCHSRKFSHMAHKYRQEDLTSPILLCWLSKPNLTEYTRSNVSKHSQSIISQSSLAEYFSLPGSDHSLARSHPNLALSSMTPTISRSNSSLSRCNNSLSNSHNTLSRSNTSLSRSNPGLTRSNTSLSEALTNLITKSKSEMKLKYVRRSSTIETTETILRIDAFHNLFLRLNNLLKSI